MSEESFYSIGKVILDFKDVVLVHLHEQFGADERQGHRLSRVEQLAHAGEDLKTDL